MIACMLVRSVVLHVGLPHKCKHVYQKFYLPTQLRDTFVQSNCVYTYIGLGTLSLTTQTDVIAPRIPTSCAIDVEYIIMKMYLHTEATPVRSVFVKSAITGPVGCCFNNCRPTVGRFETALI